jgi:hypothetical protein
LAVFVAYTLAIQALLASVGLGMSAAATPGQAGFVICSFASGLNLHAPPTNGDPKKPDPRPQCPFCFVAAQSAGQFATIGEPAVFAAYAGFDSYGAHYGQSADAIFVPRFRRTVGDPRAPPKFSV